jgi:hypothetical protein
VPSREWQCRRRINLAAAEVSRVGNVISIATMAASLHE